MTTMKMCTLNTIQNKKRQDEKKAKHEMTQFNLKRATTR